MPIKTQTITPMKWQADHLSMLDQRLLPLREEWLQLRTHEEVGDAIRSMVVRGAPAIGIAAAYGMALAVLNGAKRDQANQTLADSRPTAVNLFWALDRISALPEWSFEAVLKEAQAIEREDLEMNLAIGKHGAALIPQGAKVLTICNTGGLATAGHGTALGVIRTAHEQGKSIHVYACETRPRMQGLRLTAYELVKEGIPFHSIADGVAASLMKDGKVDVVIAGADRIAANGDAANKIGTYSLAVLARHHGIPFYIAAPSSTLDPSLPTGDLIPIEERACEELTEIDGVRVAPENCSVFNPAFDVTPGALITGIITEKGVHTAPYNYRLPL
ncbi:MAG: methylthioribose-phosphate isomerase [Fimbriimonadaceae bacterium]|jgi:methylthioribose-1-phosphate isomerase|nr:methylthioribose-phosphate isomerase [Fimbriimonadaceae bacterium]